MKQNCLYVLQHISSGLVKIGVTGNWKSRANQLYVGSRCNALMVVACEDNYHEESKLHCDYDEQRIPQTEWFHLNKRQTKALLKQVAVLGKEIKWRPGDAKPKQKRKPRKPQPIFTEEQLESWEARLITLPFVSVVEVYADAVVFYGLELHTYWGKWDLAVIGSIGFNKEGATEYMFGFEYGRYNCLVQKSNKYYENEEDFFKNLSHAAAEAYKSGCDRVLMKPGTKIERPTGKPLDWCKSAGSDVDLGQYLPQTP